MLRSAMRVHIHRQGSDFMMATRSGLILCPVTFVGQSPPPSTTHQLLCASIPITLTLSTGSPKEKRGQKVAEKGGRRLD